MKAVFTGVGQVRKEKLRRVMAARGLRERLVPVARAPGEPFDHGRFELVEEALDAPDLGRTLDMRQRVAQRSRSLPVLAG